MSGCCNVSASGKRGASPDSHGAQSDRFIRQRLTATVDVRHPPLRAAALDVEDHRLPSFARRVLAVAEAHAGPSLFRDAAVAQPLLGLLHDVRRIEMRAIAHAASLSRALVYPARQRGINSAMAHSV